MPLTPALVWTRSCPNPACRATLEKVDPCAPWVCQACGWRSDQAGCLTCGRGLNPLRDSVSASR
jgi:hypothetical protein